MGEHVLVARRNNFDLLRLFAAVTVVVHHVVTYLGVPFLWVTPENGWWFSGGVPLFFILSGFLVCRSAEKAQALRLPWWDFYWNRFLRIAPALYFAGLGLIVLLFFFGGIEAATPASFIGLVASYALFAPIYNPALVGDFGGGIGNSSLWTIPVEVSFYVFVPVIVLAARRLGPKTALIGFAVVAVASLLIYSALGGNAAAQTSALLFGYTAFPFLIYFLIGIVTDRVWDRLPHSGWLALAGAVAYFAITIPGLRGPNSSDLLVNALSAFPLAYSAMWFGRNAVPLAPDVFRKTDLSFGIYLWHQPLINAALVTGVFVGQRGETAVVAILAATMAVAFLSNRVVERPALRLKRYSLSDTKEEPRPGSRAEPGRGSGTTQRSKSG